MDKPEQLTPPSTQQPKRHRLPLKINGISRKRNDRSPLSHHETTKEWSSQDTGLSRFSVSTTFLNHSGKANARARASLDCGENLVEDYEVEKPPGLDKHCPESSLRVG